MLPIGVFHKRTKLAILSLLSALYSLFFAVSFFIYIIIMLVNPKLDVSGYCSPFQSWYGTFVMVELKQNWQYWHSCIVHGLNLISCKISQAKI